MLDWFLWLSAAAFSALVALLLVAWRAAQRATDRLLEDLRLELGVDEHDWNPDDWTWLVDMADPTGLPMYVPDDVADQALLVLATETMEELQSLKAQQWKWVVDAQAVRGIMYIAQQEPNIELALLTWVAQTSGPGD